MSSLRIWGAMALLAAGFSMGMAIGCDVKLPDALDAPLVGVAEEAKPSGTCGPGGTCDDGNPCTQDTCNKQNKCVFTALNKTPCGVNDTCSTGDVCKKGVCTIGTILQPDGSTCTSPNGAGSCQGHLCQPKFGPQKQYAAGIAPVSLAIGDFDGDGDRDLAVANEQSDNVSILLNNGSGAFAAGQTVPTGAGSEPTSVAAGDIDGDGDIDLAVANFGNGNVSVLQNNGSANFLISQTIILPAGTNPFSVAMGNLNGDNLLDLATANSVGDSVSVLRQTITGSFNTQTIIFPAGSTPDSVAMGDLNIVNNATTPRDLVVANLGNSTASVLLNDGTGFFPTINQTITVDGQPNAVAVGDLDNDADNDFVTANSNNTVSVVLQAGSGTFAVASTLTGSGGFSQNAVAVGDLDGDGFLDIVTANGSDNTVNVFFNDGTGSFQPVEAYPTGSAPAGVAVGDLNATIEVRRDIATANSNSNNVSVLLNNIP